MPRSCSPPSDAARSATCGDSSIPSRSPGWSWRSCDSSSLAGDGADRFAMRQGMTPVNLLTDGRKAMWQKWADEHPDGPRVLDDTVQFPAEQPMFRKQCCPNFRRRKWDVRETCRTTSITTRSACWRSMRRASWPAPARRAACRSRCPAASAIRRSSATGCTSIPPRRRGGHRHGRVDHGRLRQLSRRRTDGPRRLARRRRPRSAATHCSTPTNSAAEDQAAIITLNPLGQWSSASLRPGYRTAVHTSSRNELVEPDRVLLA